MRRKNTIESFDHAFKGLIHTLKTQRHMRWHLVIGSAVLVLALGLDLTRVEILIVFGTITFVLVSEMINTAIEVAVDLVTKEYHPLAAVAKNVAAGAVLLAATNAVIVGYLIFVPGLESLLPSVLEQIRSSPPYLTLIAIILVTVTVILLKSLLNQRGSIVQGGMPSGHTAVASALATAIVFFANQQPTIMVLAILLALLVAESRLETRIHTVLEVAAGAIIGVLLTVLVFQCLYRLV